MKDDGIETESDSLAKGYALGVTVFSISVQIVIFPLLGLWIDKQFGTGILFGTLGFFAGLYSAISQLLRLSKKTDKPKK